MEPILPMEPKSSHSIPVGEDWVAQIKWDGVRMLLYKNDDDVSLFNRKKNVRTGHYPELTGDISYVAAQSVILDGEVIALGDDGKPSFHEVMRRDGIRNMGKVPFMQAAVPITYMIFDLLFLDGKWVTDYPLDKRIELLKRIIIPAPHVQLVNSHTDGSSLYRVIEENGMEGIVMKKMNSPYVMGEKKETWLKIKNYRDMLAVIGGYTVRGDVVNSLLLGVYDEHGAFIYVGHSGTGKFTQEEWRELSALLKGIGISEQPFRYRPERYRDAFWVKPQYVVKVKFVEWTSSGHLRQPSIQGLVDMNARDCIIER